jgi:hypothetical protein
MNALVVLAVCGLVGLAVYNWRHHLIGHFATGGGGLSAEWSAAHNTTHDHSADDGQAHLDAGPDA